MPSRVAILILLLAITTTVSGADPPTVSSHQINGVDPVFAAGLVTVKKATGFMDSLPDESSAGWRPNLQLLIGVEAVENTRRMIYFIALTTLPLPTNGVAPRLSPPPLVTNLWGSVETNRSASGVRATNVPALYPLRVRVFDDQGRPRAEGESALPLLTNGLAELCRLSVETAAAAGQGSDKPSLLDSHRFPQNAELKRSVVATSLWLSKVLEQGQTVPAVNEIWKKALSACRLPGLIPLMRGVISGKSPFELEIKLREISPVGAPTPGSGPGEYLLPVHLTCGSKELTRIEVTVAPPRGAGIILAGIRSVRATHPTKPQQEFTAQILAAGMSRPQ